MIRGNPRRASAGPRRAMDDIRGTVDAVYRAESRRVLATLIRLLGDFDLAEEALHEAFRAAVEQWPRDGVPANPRAWLVSAGRFKAIDRIRRARALRARSTTSWPSSSPAETRTSPPMLDEQRRGRSPAADLHLLPSGAAARRAGRADAARSVRAHDRGDRARLPRRRRRRSRSASCARRPRSATRAFPYEVPTRASCRSGSTRCCASSISSSTKAIRRRPAARSTRHDLSGEAIRLGRLLVELLPEPEAIGLLALMLLHESRRAARTSPTGDLVLLDDQDRSLWNRDADRRGHGARGARAGAATLRPLHAAGRDRRRARRGARRRARPTGGEIVGLYDVLLRLEPSPVVELNRAVAVAMRDGPAAGLALDRRAARARRARRLPPRARGARGSVPPPWARPPTRARRTSARSRSTQLEPERRFLERRLAELAH